MCSSDLGSQLLAATVALRNVNVAPLAPTLVSPVGNSYVDRNAPVVLSWSPNDPNRDDTQSRYALQYRPVGTTAWTASNVFTATPQATIPAGLAAGQYEWQVRTYDSSGLVGPYSASGFFQAATLPAAPTITSPAVDATVGSSVTVVWTSDNQERWQLRRVADDGVGAPDPTVVYYDSGQVSNVTTRQRAVALPVNGRPEHLQVRVSYLGLWSAWASVRVVVDYIRPRVPTVTLTADAATGSLLVAITNLASQSGQPAAASNEVWMRRAGRPETAIRLAVGLAPSTAWRWWTPASGVAYETQVITTGANTATAATAWTP